MESQKGQRKCLRQEKGEKAQNYPLDNFIAECVWFKVRL